MEVDETYVGGRQRNSAKRAKGDNKTPVVALVERGSGKVRAFPMMRVTSETGRRLTRT